MRRLTLITATSAVILFATPFAAHAAREGLIPAPPATATATALSVADILHVSDTGAQATTDSSSAQASVIDVGGAPLLGLGGSQSGPGTSDGALLDTGATLPVQAEVAPWSASASTSETERTSSGSAAAARAEVPETLHLDVLESESQATHTDEKSTGTGASNAADLGVLDILQLVLLHSEVTSDGEGTSFLVGANGIEIGSDEQLEGICSLVAHPLLAVTCVEATGGLAGGLSEVLRAESGLLPPVELASAFAVESSGGVGEQVATPETEVAPIADSTETPRELGETEEPTSGGGTLPRTGAGLAASALLGGLALALGAALRRAGRRSES
ncbi:MAG: hypothetical protein ACRDZ3_20470 [Acidimicrobiia bacterium]